MKKIAIQGVPGSYHDIAAHKFFPGEEIELICCSTFEEVFANIKQDSNVIGMLAIENTIAGSLLHNYELLRESGMTIVGEHKLRIKHSFMCLPDDNWETLTEVNSHPVALAQCREFLIQHPKLKIVETEDTAGSAEAIKRENLKGHAAICSRYAADLYGMKVLEEGIETNKHNFTRFLVVADPWKADDLRPDLKHGQSLPSKMPEAPRSSDLPQDVLHGFSNSIVRSCGIRFSYSASGLSQEAQNCCCKDSQYGFRLRCGL